MLENAKAPDHSFEALCSEAPMTLLVDDIAGRNWKRSRNLNLILCIVQQLRSCSDLKKILPGGLESGVLEAGGLEGGGLEAGGLEARGLEARPTDFGSKNPLTWESRVWGSRGRGSRG